jgi:hypothetical protein
MGRKNLPLNQELRICSMHFVNSSHRRLRPDEYPTVNLPAITTPLRKRKEPLQRCFVVSASKSKSQAQAVQTDISAFTQDHGQHTCTGRLIDTADFVVQTDMNYELL